MATQTRVKESFSVIGKEGSTRDGEQFVRKLWAEVEARFSEVASLAKKDENGGIVGLWGVMSDLSRSFQPWEDNFTKGLYLAGVEVPDDAEAPDGWVKWTVPGYEYVYAVNAGIDVFAEVLQQLAENGVSLIGAVHDFHDPKDGRDYVYFPIRRL